MFRLRGMGASAVLPQREFLLQPVASFAAISAASFPGTHVCRDPVKFNIVAADFMNSPIAYHLGVVNQLITNYYVSPVGIRW